MPALHTFGAVFGNTQRPLRVSGVEAVEPGAVLVHRAHVPAEIVVIGQYVGDLVMGRIQRHHGDLGHSGEPGGIQLVGQVVHSAQVVLELRRVPADGDLVGNAPETDGWMVIILDYQLFQLADTVVVGGRVFIEHADKRDLRPDDKAHLVTGVIEILGVLVVGKAYGVGSQLLDDAGILKVVGTGEGVALVQLVLVAADAPERRLYTVDDKTLTWSQASVRRWRTAVTVYR